MKKVFLFLMLPIMVMMFNFCSKEEGSGNNNINNNENYYFYTLDESLSFDARLLGSKKVTIRSNVEWDFKKDSDWVIVTRNDSVLTISVTENTGKARNCSISIIPKSSKFSSIQISVNQSEFYYTQEELDNVQTELAEIVNDIIGNFEYQSLYYNSLEGYGSQYFSESNKIRIENGIFYYDGGTAEKNGSTYVNEQCQIPVTLTKESHETFYPYHLHECIKIKGDDGRDLTVSGTIYITDYVPNYAPNLSERKAGEFVITTKGKYEYIFYYVPE